MLSQCSQECRKIMQNVRRHTQSGGGDFSNVDIQAFDKKLKTSKIMFERTYKRMG